MGSIGIWSTEVIDLKVINQYKSYLTWAIWVVDFSICLWFEYAQQNKNLPFDSFHSCQWLVRCTYPQDTLSFLQTQTTCRKKTSCGGKRTKHLFFCVKEKTIIPKKLWQKSTSSNSLVAFPGCFTSVLRCSPCG